MLSHFVAKYRVVDNHWSCIMCHDFDTAKDVFPGSLPVLADLLWRYGFNIPECVDYCLAHNDTFSLKFRCTGGAITIYINPFTDVNRKQINYVKNAFYGN